MAEGDPAEEMLNELGLWECGTCHAIVGESHYYTNRATGVMSHDPDAERRAASKDQCGWQFDDDYGTVVRCEHRHGHGGEHRSGGSHRIRWNDRDVRGFGGAIPPYKHRNEASA